MVVASQLIAAVKTTGVPESKQELQSMGQAVKETSGGFKSMLGNALSFASGQAIFNMVGQAVGFLKNQVADSIKLAMDHEQIMEQTAKVLKSTGGAAGMTQQSLEDLASSLQKTTFFSKDATEEGENLLLTFTGIGKDVFPLATKTMLDMSKAMGQDIKSTAIQMGKALNDPAQGLTALTRVGVTFTEQQKQQIKAMTDAGNVAGAQKIMLAELQREFGGSADATATAAGRWEILKNRMNDFKEQAAAAVLPVLMNIADFLGGALFGAFDKIGGAIHYVQNVLKSVDLTDFHDAWANVESAVRSLSQTFGSLKSSLDPVKGDFDPLAEAIQRLAKGGLKILTDGLGKLYEGLSAVNGLFHGGKGPLTDYVSSLKQWEPPLRNIANLLIGQFKDGLKFASDEAKQIGDWFKTSLLPALKEAEPGFNSLAHTILDTVVPALINIRGLIIEVAEHAFQKWLPIVEKIVPILIKFGGILAKDISDALKFIVPRAMEAEKTIAKFAEQIQDRVAPIVKKWLDDMMPKLQAFADWWQANWPTILAVLENVWTQISGIVKIAWSLVSGIILIGLDILSGNWKQAWEDVKGMLAGVWDGMMTYLRGVWGNIQLIFKPIDQWFHDRWQSVVDGFHSILGGIGDAAHGIFNNVTGAIRGAFNNIIDLVNNVIGHINSINVGGVGIHIDMIPHLASGTNFFPGGLALVGEHGPELAYLPTGTRVVPNSQLSSAMSGGSKQPVYITFQVGSQTIARAFLPDLVNEIRHGTGNWAI